MKLSVYIVAFLVLSGQCYSSDVTLVERLTDITTGKFIEITSDDKLLGRSFRVFFNEAALKFNAVDVSDGSTIIKLNQTDVEAISLGNWRTSSIEVMKYYSSLGRWAFFSFGKLEDPAPLGRELGRTFCGDCHSRSVGRQPIFADVYIYGDVVQRTVGGDAPLTVELARNDVDVAKLRRMAIDAKSYRGILQEERRVRVEVERPYEEADAAVASEDAHFGAKARGDDVP